MEHFSKAMAFCAMILSTVLSGCYVDANTMVKPSNNYVTERVTFSDIDAIKASSSVDVVYIQVSGTPYAEIYAPDNIVPLIKVEQTGNCLSVGFKSNTSIHGRYKCEVRVFAPEVTSFFTSSSSDLTLANGLKTTKDVVLKASSSGDIDVKSLQCGNLEMSTSSSGDIEVKTVECTGSDIKSSSSGDCTVTNMSCTGDVKASTSSSSDIILSGTCRNAIFSANSSGGIYAKDLCANDVSAKASSAGDVECHVSGVLSTSVSSAGNIRYKGSPSRIEGKMKGVSRL